MKNRAQLIYTGDASALKRWLAIRPHNAVTVLDTHDGIGVVDVDLIAMCASITCSRLGVQAKDRVAWHSAAEARA